MHYLGGAALTLVALMSGAAAAQEPMVCGRPLVSAKPQQALVVCTQALEQRDLSSAHKLELLKHRGRALVLLRRYDEAATEFETAMALAPNDPDAIIRRGLVYYAHGLHRQALAYAQRALRLDPKWVRAHTLMAFVFAATNRKDLVLATYRRALELVPEDPELHYQRFLFLAWRDHERDAAIVAAENVLTLPSATISNAADVLYEDGPASYRTATLLQLASLLNRMGRRDAALKVYDDAVTVDRSSLTLTKRARGYLFGRFSTDKRANPMIEADLDEAIRLNPENWVAFETRGRFEFHEKDYRAALASYDQAIAINPDTGQSHWGKALSLRALQRPEEAVEAVMAGLAVDADLVEEKLMAMQQHGYLPALETATDPAALIRDGVTACMLDERCW